MRGDAMPRDADRGQRQVARDTYCGALCVVTGDSHYFHLGRGGLEMRWLRRALAFSVGACALCTPLDLVGVQTSESRPETRRHALLIGVTDYPGLSRDYWLRGPANDVELMADVLQRAPFSVAAANITRLAGWPADPAQRPTRANIEQVFQRLEQTVAPNDRVVVFLAGHGSQQPANVDRNDAEPDGMDEIFLPADVGRWNGKAGAVQNAIVDDDLGRWLAALRNRGAFVWLIVDSCQSGTMARGTNTERDRWITPGDLGVPPTAFRSTGQQETPETSLLDLAGSGQLAAMYAAQTRETTPERPMPGPGGQWHGLFTYTLARVLEESQSPLTYRELSERIVARYRAEGRAVPNPGFEGGAVDRTILEQRTWPERPDMLLTGTASGGRGTLRAGAVHGLTAGSILEVFPAAGTAGADTAIGYVKVLSVGATSAVVEPATYNDRAANLQTLAPGARARVAEYALGLQRLRVGVQRIRRERNGVTDYETVARADGPAHLERLVEEGTRTDGVAVRVSSDEDAEWVLRDVAGNVVLVPAHAWGDARTSARPVAYEVGRAGDADLGERLRTRLRSIVRARNLLQLAVSMDGARGGDIDIDLEIVRLVEGKQVPVPIPPGGRTLHNKDEVAFVLRNRGRWPIDVTLLHVGHDLGISMLPRTDVLTVANLEIGRTFTTSTFAVGADGVELDQVVAIAVRSSPVPINFGALTQPSLTQMQEALRTRGAVASGPGSALQALLADAMYSGTTTRALRATEVKEHAMRLITWRSLP